MQVTYQQLVDFINVSFVYIKKKPENANTKLAYAISKVTKKAEKAIKPYKEIIEDQVSEADEISIKLASTDKDKLLVYDLTKNAEGAEVRNYKYTPENLTKRNKELRELNKKYGEKIEELMEKSTEIDVYIAAEIPDDLTFEEKQAFSGIVIPLQNN